jgi:hypothetical protein
LFHRRNHMYYVATCGALPPEGTTPFPTAALLRLHATTDYPGWSAAFSSAEDIIYLIKTSPAPFSNVSG